MSKPLPKVPMPSPSEAVLRRGQETLEAQAFALKRAAAALDARFSDFVGRLVSVPSPARVILMGVGKASYIAMKFSATLASLGIPSFFLHPAEAVHGDLGRVTSQDVVVALSNSGETPELIAILSALSRIGATVLAVTRDESSTLARSANLSLIYGKVAENGHLAIAPTASTTVMLGICDAVAMAVAEARGVRLDDFAQNHPGGDIGRSLLPVTEVMRSGDFHCVVHHTMKAREVLHKYTLTPGRPGAATVVDDEGKVIGIFTDGDLRRCVDTGQDLFDMPIASVMSPSPKQVSHNELAKDALSLMSRHQIDQVIVVNDSGIPLGLIDIQDLVALFYPAKSSSSPQK